MPLDLNAYQAVLLDLDGTIYHEEHALPGAVELIRRLQAENRVYACLTNSTSSPDRLAARLKRMGVAVDPAHIYTAAAAACDYVLQRWGEGELGREGVQIRESVGVEGMKRHGDKERRGPGNNETTRHRDEETRGQVDSETPRSDALASAAASLQSDPSLSPQLPHSPSLQLPLARVFNLSTEGVEEMLDGKVHWVTNEAEPCHAVICGVPLNVFATEQRQRTAMVLLRQGAALVAICADRVYPSPRGLEFGVGAFAAMFAYAANVAPVFCGKPEPLFFHELCRRLGVHPEGCVLVGDNLESDIAGAKGVGMKTILTLTGVATRADVELIPPMMRPDAVIADLSDLLT